MSRYQALKAGHRSADYASAHSCLRNRNLNGELSGNAKGPLDQAAFLSFITVAGSPSMRLLLFREERQTPNASRVRLITVRRFWARNLIQAALFICGK